MFMDAEEPEPVKLMHETVYKVQEGDTLGHIAKKFYNRASKWPVIYEANMDKISDPQRIKPGTELVIPNLEEVTGEIK